MPQQIQELYFRGGVDAFNTLFKHIEEKPTLITIRGSDIKLNNIDGWKKVSEHHIKIAEKYGLKYCFIKTNFRTFINYSKLSKYVRRYIGGEWWHEFQHGIGILGNVAPIAYLNKYKTLYIASSLTKEEKGKVTCASDPSIDNYLKFASCKVVHDGYEYNRQDKIKNICEFIDKNNENSIDIRVCWISSGGNNCCNCEKCYRTMLGIITEKRNPNDFGFDLTVEKAQKMFKELPKHVKYMKQNYFCIQKRFNENYTLEETPKDLIWFRSIKMKYNKPFYIKAKDKSIHILKKVKNKILG